MGKIKVLIVDDHDFFLEALKIQFSISEHVEVSGEAQNGEEAIEVLSQGEHDIILVDYVMPIMDGLEFLEKIKELGIGTKVVFMSSYDEQSLIDESLRLGASAFISKMMPAQYLIHNIIRVYNGERGLIYKETSY